MAKEREWKQTTRNQNMSSLALSTTETEQNKREEVVIRTGPVYTYY